MTNSSLGTLGRTCVSESNVLLTQTLSHRPILFSSMSIFVRLAFLALVTFPALALRADVVINEIMYHPASENSAEEFIELYNSSPVAIDLSGWQFTSGVSFTFPGGATIAPS